jgi:ATP-binding cassette, subfamily B, bacterial
MPFNSAIKRFPFFGQQESKDCGPACLRMVAAWYGKKFTLNELRGKASINRDGTTLYGIAQAAEKTGFETAGIKVTANALSNIPLPAILHWNKSHFTVLYKINRNKYYIADPAVGKLKLGQEELLRHWLGENSNEDSEGVVLLLEPSPGFSSENLPVNKNTSAWRMVGQYVMQYRGRVMQLMVLLFIGSIFQFVFPYLTQGIVDRGIRNKDLNFIQLMLLAQFTLFFAQTFTEFIRARILLFISTHVNLSILSDFWNKLMRLPMYFFETRKTGDIIQRINDHRRIETFITGSALHTVFSVFSIAVFSVVLFIYNPVIFFVFLGGSLLYCLWIRIFLKKRRVLDYNRFAAAAKESSASMQMIHGMHEIKLNNAENAKRKEWESIQSNLFRFNFKSLSLNQAQQAGAFFINQGKNILITYLVAVAVLNGFLTLGQMLAIQFIIGQLNSPVEQLIQFTQQAQEAKLSLERLNEIQLMEDEEPPGKKFQHDIETSRDIRFKSLSFTYPGNSIAAIKNIDLLIPGKKVTALVGMSGSGKSTIIKLLLQFYNDYDGVISVGKKDLKNISPAWWRSVCGSVMQEGYIFNDSIAKNIALAEESPDYEKIMHACRIAEIAEFIDSLPQGLDTKIGAEGSGLSAGQKQRLLIARAVYKDPAFLFFDEATNALDANNEKAIMENMDTFFKGRTVIIAAHRLSTVMNADKIIVIDKGSIIEEGIHEELIQRNGKYFELVRNQLEIES